MLWTLIKSFALVQIFVAQIKSAVDACGGTHRATADELVTWILGQGSDDDAVDIPDDEVTEEDQEMPSVETILPPQIDSKVAEEEAARQKEEEEAARRLAAKREETRRRNIAWNNREQARQQQEAKAKVAQKAVQQLHAPSRQIPSTGMPPNGLQSGVVNTAKYSLPPAELSNTSQWQPASQHHQAYAHPRIATTRMKTPPMHGASLSSGSFPPINDDDKTVSSFGSNRGLSVSSREFVPAKFTAAPPVLSSTTPPPGFRSAATAQPVALPMRPPVSSVPEHSSETFTNDTCVGGEIRATAKAFVPSISSQSNVNVSAPLKNDFGSFQNQLPGQSLVGAGLPPGFQTQAGPAGPSSLLGSGLPNSFDQVPAMNPLFEDATVPVASLIGGNILEDPVLPMSLGGNSHPESIGGSTLLSSISNSGSVVGGSAIWGDLGNDGIPSLGIGISDQPSLFSKERNEDKKLSWDMPLSGQSIW